MRRFLFLSFTTSALLTAACPPQDDAKCRDACTAAARCGILPSTLGGSPGDDYNALIAACLDRCVNSRSHASVSADTTNILACLEQAVGADVCDVGTCVYAAVCLRGQILSMPKDALPDAVIGTSTVTFQLVPGVLWLLTFQQQSGFCDLDNCDADPCRSEAVGHDYRRPVCQHTSCQLNSEDEGCDPRLCHISGGHDDCALYGIETVQFDYYDGDLQLHRNARTATCEEAYKGVTVEGIPAGQLIYPIARFYGRWTANTLAGLNGTQSATGRPYCWLSYASGPTFYEVGWLVRAGEALIPVPSPSAAQYSGYLPWGCEKLDGLYEGCDNTIDDDGDGLIDVEDPDCVPEADTDAPSTTDAPTTG